MATTEPTTSTADPSAPEPTAPTKTSYPQLIPNKKALPPPDSEEEGFFDEGEGEGESEGEDEDGGSGSTRGVEIVKGRFKNVSPARTKRIVRKVDRHLGNISKPLVGVQIDAKKELAVPTRVRTVGEPPLVQTVKALPALTGKHPTIITHVTDADKDFLQHQKDLVELRARDRYAVETLAQGSKQWIAEHCPGTLDRIAETMDKISDCRRMYDKLKMNGVDSAEDVAFMMKWDEYKNKFPYSYFDTSGEYPRLPYKNYEFEDPYPQKQEAFERGFYNMNRRMNREFNKWYALQTLMKAEGQKQNPPMPKYGPNNNFATFGDGLYSSREKFENAKKDFRTARDDRIKEREDDSIGLSDTLGNWVAQWFGYGAATKKNPYINTHDYR